MKTIKRKMENLFMENQVNKLPIEDGAIMCENISKKAMEKVLLQEMTRNLRYVVAQKEREGNVDSKLLTYMRALHQQNLMLSKKAATDMYNLVTVCPEPGKTFQELHKQVKRLGRKKTVGGIYAVYEFGKSMEHLHVHILLKQQEGHSATRNDLWKNTGNTFKRLCDVTNPKYFDIVGKDDETHFDNCVEYLCGIKKDDIKMEAVETDVQVRLEKGISQMYHFGQHFISGDKLLRVQLEEIDSKDRS